MNKKLQKYDIKKQFKAVIVVCSIKEWEKIKTRISRSLKFSYSHVQEGYALFFLTAD